MSAGKAVALGLAASLLGSAAAAQDLTIRDFVGTVNITTGDASVSVTRDHKRLDVDGLDIDGGIDKPGRSGVCGSSGGWFGGSKKTDIKDFAQLDITLPEGATLTIENSLIALDASDTALSEADVELTGCLGASLGDVLDAKVAQSGSGSTELGRIGTLKLGKSGSGRVRIEDVGTLDLAASGSGDMDIGRIGVSGQIAKSGSADVGIGEAVGPLRLSMSGSGDAEVESGAITELTVSKSGSGRVDIGASVESAKIKASGSGDVRISSTPGSIEQATSGSMRVSIGGSD